MAIFKVEVFKLFAGENWGNVYHVNAADIEAAQDAAATIGATEISFHQQEVLIQYARVSDVLPDTDVFVTLPFNENGDSTGTGNLLPLWDTLRIDFSVAAGRPGRKYYRGCLTTDNITDDFATIDSDAYDPVVDALGTLLSTLTAASTPLVQPDGDLLLTATAHPTVQMRQLHRKRRPAPS
jgi:hypothetical protein